MVVYVSKIKTVLKLQIHGLYDQCNGNILNGSICEQGKTCLNYKCMVCMINVMTVLNGGIYEQDNDYSDYKSSLSV